MNFSKSGKMGRVSMSIDVDDAVRNINASNPADFVEEQVCPYCKERVSSLLSNPIIERAAQLGIIPILEQIVPNMMPPVESGPMTDVGVKDEVNTECICPQCGYKDSSSLCVGDKCPECDAVLVEDMQENVEYGTPGEEVEILADPNVNVEVVEDEGEGVTLVIKICEKCLNRAIELAGGDKMSRLAQVTDNLLYCQTCGYSEVYDGGDISRHCPVCDMPNALNLLPKSDTTPEEM